MGKVGAETDRPRAERPRPAIGQDCDSPLLRTRKNGRSKGSRPLPPDLDSHWTGVDRDGPTFGGQWMRAKQRDQAPRRANVPRSTARDEATEKNLPKADPRLIPRMAENYAFFAVALPKKRFLIFTRVGQLLPSVRFQRLDCSGYQTVDLSAVSTT